MATGKLLLYAGTEQTSKSAKTPREMGNDMKICMIIMFVVAVGFAIASVFARPMIAGVCLCMILGIMFSVLSKSPGKGEAVLKSAEGRGMPKSVFVCICLLAAAVLCFTILNIELVDNFTDALFFM